MKIAFVNPPPYKDNKFIEAEDCCWGAGNRRVLPSMLLSCMSNTPGSHFIDLTIDPPSKLLDLEPDVIIYTMTWNYYKTTFKQMVNICGNIPQIIIAVPPGYAMDFAKFRPNPFAVIYSEPEFAISSITKGLLNWRSQTDGIIYMDKGEIIQKNFIKCNFHRNAPIDYSKVPAHYWKKYHVAVYQATRGCPYRCKFCVWGGSTVTDRTFKMKPANLVANDIFNLRKFASKYRKTSNPTKPINLYIIAAQLTTNLRWIKEFHAIMKKKSYPFQSNVNLFELTDEKMKLLMEAGMVNTSAGAEALTDHLLEILGKKHRFDDIVRGLKILDDSGITYNLHMRTGFGETPSDIEETVSNIKRLKEHGIKHASFHFGPIIYYKGTEINENPPCELIIHPNYPAECYNMKKIPRWNPVVDILNEYGWINPKIAKR